MLLDLDILERLTLVNILFRQQMAPAPLLFFPMYSAEFSLFSGMSIYTMVPCSDACINC